MIRNGLEIQKNKLNIKNMNEEGLFDKNSDDVLELALIYLCIVCKQNLIILKDKFSLIDQLVKELFYLVFVISFQ